MRDDRLPDPDGEGDRPRPRRTRGGKAGGGIPLSKVLPEATFFACDDIIAAGCSDDPDACRPGDVFVARLTAEGGLQWPCYDDAHPGEAFLHGRLWERPVRGPRAPFSLVKHELPLDQLNAEFPLRLTTGRRLAEYNTGVQTGSYASPTRRGETIDLSPEDARRLGLTEGQPARVTSRRGAVVAPVHVDQGLRPGLTFMTFHFPDDVATNMLTSDATDPLVGTAEFKATAVRGDNRGTSGRRPPARCTRHRLGRRHSRYCPRRPLGSRWPPADGQSGSVTPRVPRRAGCHRLDQPWRPQLHLHAALGAAGGSVGCRHLLPPAGHRAAACGRGPRVR